MKKYEEKVDSVLCILFKYYFSGSEIYVNIW